MIFYVLMFVGPDFQLKLKFDTIQDLKQQQMDKKKLATLAENEKEQMKKANEKNNKNAGANPSEKEKIIPTGKENENDVSGIVIFLFEFFNVFIIFYDLCIIIMIFKFVICGFNLREDCRI